MTDFRPATVALDYSSSMIHFNVVCPGAVKSMLANPEKVFTEEDIARIDQTLTNHSLFTVLADDTF